MFKQVKTALSKLFGIHDPRYHFSNLFRITYTNSKTNMVDKMTTVFPQVRSRGDRDRRRRSLSRPTHRQAKTRRRPSQRSQQRLGNA
jgi:hypothetical protein